MANRYANLVGSNKIKDEYTKINQGFDKVQQDMDAKPDKSIAQVNNVQMGADDTLTIEGSTGITISTNPSQKKVIVTATGTSTPGPHGPSHNNDGADPIPDLQDLTNAFDAHKAETLSDVFNVVTGYGADPSGIEDSTDAIQEAIDAASNKGGGIIYFPKGVYLCSGLEITSRLLIVGSGRGTTKFIPKDSNPIFKVNGSNYWSMRDFSIEHNRSFVSNGILLASTAATKWFTIDNVFVTSLKGYALKAEGVLWESKITNLHVRMCGDLDNDVAAIDIDQPSTDTDHINNIIFDKCFVNLSNGIAIRLRSQKDVVNTPGLRKISITNTMVHGGTNESDITPYECDSVVVDGYSDLTLSNLNVVEVADGFYGIRLDSSLSNKSQRCIIEGCRFSGPVYLGNVADTKIGTNSWLFTGNKVDISEDAVRTRISSQLVLPLEYGSFPITDNGNNTVSEILTENVLVNKNLTFGLGAGINGCKNVGGEAVIKANESSTTVTLPIEETDASYKIVVSPNFDSGGVWFTAKSASQFTINVKTAPSIDRVVDWFIYR